MRLKRSSKPASVIIHESHLGEVRPLRSPQHQPLDSYRQSDRCSSHGAPLRQAAALLENHPSIGRPGPEPGTRVLVVSGTPYLLPYRIHPNTVEILAVFHSSRQWPDSFD